MIFQTAYKIVEVKDNTIHTLFHGLNGSRTMPTGEWLRADMKVVKDGTSKTEYTSGWHVLLDYDEAENYLQKFSSRLELLEIISCKVRGIRSKVHSPSPVYLAEWIRF